MNDRIVKIAQARLPTKHGEFESHAFRNAQTGVEHLVLTKGDVTGAPVLARLHSECLTGDVFGSLRCDCGEQLELALQRIATEKRGVLVYLRGQEGRGIGLANKIRAYQLQDVGLDTVDANLALDLPVDARSYKDAVDMLRMLGVQEVRLMSNNPEKAASLETGGIRVVERVAHYLPVTVENHRYMETKRTRMGHALSRSELPASAGAVSEDGLIGA
ncbi:GTP cyclohydrolase II [Uliginosibacterium sp. H1]|uniref:GTP cyclohydrolase II n=1 Tax=Uliginosibacterium sp. H1 TaxID=3114757 RepID=UPI002E19017D|nr:GTP cyclohydrolase II [Uliginosibacterium sp. H1]